MGGVGEGIHLLVLRGRKSLWHALGQLRGQAPRDPTLNPEASLLLVPKALSECPCYNRTSCLATSELRDLDQVTLLSLATAPLYIQRLGPEVPWSSAVL